MAEAPHFARQLAAEARVVARETLKPHHAEFLAALVEGVVKRERTAMNLYPRVAGMLDAGEDVADALRSLLEAARVADEKDLLRLVATAREAESASPEQADQAAMRWLRARMKANPTKRAEVREVLFGERAALPEASGAVVVETNGHANGNGKAKRNGNGRH